MMRYAAALVLALVFTSSAQAEDISGNWILNANGWKFTMKIVTDGDTFTGTLTGINNEQTSKIEGRIDGAKITFTRVGEGQDYEGYLLGDDPTRKASNHAIAGTAITGNITFGWYATR